jgi:hypothetical protein
MSGSRLAGHHREATSPGASDANLTRARACGIDEVGEDCRQHMEELTRSRAFRRVGRASLGQLAKTEDGSSYSIKVARSKMIHLREGANTRSALRSTVHSRASRAAS